MPVWRALGDLFSGQSTLTILSYHRVLREPDPFYPDYPTQREFASQLGSAAKVLRFMPLREAVDLVLRGGARGHFGAVTFDDGYRDNLEQALPVLQSLRIPATLFVSSAYLEGETFFADGINEAIRSTMLKGLDASSLGLPYLDFGGLRARMNASTVVQQILKYRKPAERDSITARLVAMLTERPLPRLMMTADQLRTMQKAGVSIAAHGHRHPMLSMLTDAEIEADLLENMRILQGITGVRPTEFAYPNGRCGPDFSGRHADLLRRIGLEVAVTTSSGIVRQGDDPLMLPRFSPWDRSTLSFRLRLLREIRKSSGALLPAAT